MGKQLENLHVEQPILRWAGSKKKLLPILVQAVPNDFSRYIEAFAGSAVFFLKINPSHAIINDLNIDLIETYEIVRRLPRAIWEGVASLDTSPEFYYHLRSQNPVNLSKKERAIRFIYLNRFCFNGVYRTNMKGGFNVPRGSGDLTIPPYSVFQQFAKRLRSVELSHDDFECVLEKTGRGDFVYLDPPYALGKNGYVGAYGCNSFKERDEARLVNALMQADQRGAKILLSYSPSAYVQSSLQSWVIKSISVMRSVAGFSSSRRHANEVLISNYSW